MSINDWKHTATELPENDVVVDAMDSGGHVQDLKRDGNLWWFPDGSMYVYFTPIMWKHKVL